MFFSLDEPNTDKSKELSKTMINAGEDYSVSSAKQIVKKVYQQMGIATAPKAKYFLELIEGSKLVQTANGNKRTRVYRVPKKLTSH